MILVSLHVFVINKPFDLFFDHLLGGYKHVLEYFYQLCLQGSIGHLLSHFHYLYNGLLNMEGKRRERVERERKKGEGRERREREKGVGRERRKGEGRKREGSGERERRKEEGRERERREREEREGRERGREGGGK